MDRYGITKEEKKIKNAYRKFDKAIRWKRKLKKDRKIKKVLKLTAITKRKNNEIDKQYTTAVEKD